MACHRKRAGAEEPSSTCLATHGGYTPVRRSAPASGGVARPRAPSSRPFFARLRPTEMGGRTRAQHHGLSVWLSQPSPTSSAAFVCVLSFVLVVVVLFVFVFVLGPARHQAGARGRSGHVDAREARRCEARISRRGLRASRCRPVRSLVVGRLGGKPRCAWRRLQLVAARRACRLEDVMLDENNTITVHDIATESQDGAAPMAG